MDPNLNVTSVTTTALALNGLNCIKIPSCTSLTVTPITPITLSNDKTDIANVTPGTSGKIAATGALDLHHNESPSSITLNMKSSGSSDYSNSDSQNRNTFTNLGMQHSSLGNQNSTFLYNLQNQQNLNQNSYYRNSSSSVATFFANYQAQLVSPIYVGSSNIPQSSTSNNSFGSNSMLIAKSPDNEDNVPAANNVTHNDIMPKKVTLKPNTKNNVKIGIKQKSKNAANSGYGTNNKDDKLMSMEDTQIDKKEQKRLSVAGSRKRKMNHVNELEEEINQLKIENSSLQVLIQELHYQVTNLQNKLDQHKCIMNNGSI